MLEPLGDGLMLETTIEVDTTLAMTKSGGANFIPGSKILTIVYQGDALYKYQMLSPDDAKLYLPEGDSFSLVFYSHNTTDVIDVANLWDLKGGALKPDGSPGKGVSFPGWSSPERQIRSVGKKYTLGTYR